MPTLDAYDQMKEKKRMEDLRRASPAERERILQGQSPLEYITGLPSRHRQQVNASQSLSGGVAVSDCIDRYLRERKNETQGPGSTRTLSVKGYDSVRNGLSTFKKFVDGKSWTDAHTNERMLQDYRDFLETKLKASEYTANTFNDKVKFLHLHLAWLYQERLIVEIPRNIKKVCAKTRVEKCGHPLSLEQVRKLWLTADSRVRCWIALALNCGFYSKDISDLIPKDLSGAPGYVARLREKTNVPSKHCLWKVTRQLIADCRYQGSDAADKPLLLSQRGKRLNGEGTDLIGIMFKRHAKSVGLAEVAFSQLRDTGAEFVERSARSTTPYDATLVQLYLAHTDNRTARYYLNNDPVTLQLPALDKALQAMEVYFDLQHETRSTHP